MQGKICYILFLLISLNSFAQDFKEQYHRYYPDAGDTITLHTNQYGFKTKQGKLSEFVVKTVTGKNTYTLLTFRAYNEKLIIEKVENYKNGKLEGYYSESTFSKGIQGDYKNGKKHGFWRYSYDTSVIKSGFYKHDKEYGIWIIEGPDTDMQPTKIYYKNGVKIEK